MLSNLWTQPIKPYTPHCLNSCCKESPSRLNEASRNNFLFTLYIHLRLQRRPWGSGGTMALQETTGTIEYLTDAAHLLRMAAPETSSYLMSQRSGLLSQHGIAVSEIQRQHVCGACGHIAIPGQETKLKLETWRAIQKKGARTRASTGKSAVTISSPRTKILHCGNCKRDTKINLEPPGPAVRRRQVAQLRQERTMPVVEPPKPTANASSKKRAKNRKAGLQALLSGQQQQAANPLSLAHFMKK